MINAKKILTIITLFVAITISAQETPTSVIQKALGKVNTGAFVANYMMSNVLQRGGSPEVYRGTITMKGSKYMADSEGVKAWFDGKTQWVYIPEDHEVTITEPTQKEAASLNPMLLVKGLQKSCTLVFSKTVKSDKEYVVEFYPKEKFSELLYLRVLVRKSDFVPTHIKMVATKGSSTDVRLTNQKTNQLVDDSFFLFSKSKYPKATLNDLR